jgi:DNA-3-methyladenine glycosylase
VKRLTRSFFARPSQVVAPELLGCEFRFAGLSGRIDEVEAYGGADDAASHAFRGLTARNRVMFGPPGHLYVYFIYGMYFCANIVTGPDGDGQAVLLRSVSPVCGLDTMRARRPTAKNDRSLANGPGKLCAAFGITSVHDGLDLCRGDSGVWRSGGAVGDAAASPRVGISKEVDRLWRWNLVD